MSVATGFTIVLTVLLILGLIVVIAVTKSGKKAGERKV